jgi:hypothetical protein
LDENAALSKNLKNTKSSSLPSGVMALKREQAAGMMKKRSALGDVSNVQVSLIFYEWFYSL